MVCEWKVFALHYPFAWVKSGQFNAGIYLNWETRCILLLSINTHHAWQTLLHVCAKLTLTTKHFVCPRFSRCRESVCFNTWHVGLLKDCLCFCEIRISLGLDTQKSEERPPQVTEMSANWAGCLDTCNFSPCGLLVTKLIIHLRTLLWTASNTEEKSTKSDI